MTSTCNFSYSSTGNCAIGYVFDFFEHEQIALMLVLVVAIERSRHLRGWGESSPPHCLRTAAKALLSF